MDTTIKEGVEESNLELIINGEHWTVIILKDTNPEEYYAVNQSQKTLYIHNHDIERAKYSTWLNYKNT